MKRQQKRWLRIAAVSAVTTAALVTAACGSSNNSSSSAKVPTVGYFAEAPATTPNYIFPMDGGSYFSVANINQFQNLMYRPLYWFGDNGKVSLNSSLSLAKTPVFSNGGKTVTITMNNYKWSDGSPVTSRDVAFWINLMKAAVKSSPSNWGGYVPGYFPDNVTSFTTPNANTIVLNLNASYGSTWFTYNQLSQITPIPHSWDVESTGGAVGNYDQTPAGALAVFNYLNTQSQDTATYASNPLWSTVDGPWQLTDFTTSGEATFVPNKNYSGPIKPSLKQFIELPYTTDTAEFNVLKSGATVKPNAGYVPSQDLAQKNVSGYQFAPSPGWQITYFIVNYTDPQTGSIFSQPYVMAALQSLVDQNGFIKAFMGGYGYATYGPVPVKPATNFVDSTETNNPYPYSVSTATKMLTSHGWKEVNGVMTCVSPGTSSSECGAGITSNQTMTFKMDYVSGTQQVTQEVTQLTTDWALAGVKIVANAQPFNTVLGNASTACNKSGPESSCGWQMAFWGGGWIYAPDYYPTGEDLWQTGASSNWGGYSNPETDKLIAATTQQNGTSALYSYENYLTKNNPVIWLPVADALGEFSSNMSGYAPIDPLQNIYPENWRFS